MLRILDLGSGESGVRVAGSWPCRPKGDELAGASEAGTAGDLACMWTVEVGFGFTRLRLIRAAKAGFGGCCFKFVRLRGYMGCGRSKTLSRVIRTDL